MRIDEQREALTILEDLGGGLLAGASARALAEDDLRSGDRLGARQEAERILDHIGVLRRNGEIQSPTHVESATIPKSILSLAGEYFVAAELSRWGFMAAITYGSAKRVDIQVTNPTNRRLLWIEAKTTQRVRPASNGNAANARWVVNPTQLGDPTEGSATVEDEVGADFYVFVLLKPQADERPRYFVATREEVLAGVKQSRDRYNERRAAKGKEPFAGKGVPGVTLDQLVAAGFENGWGKIVQRLTA